MVSALYGDDSLASGKRAYRPELWLCTQCPMEAPQYDWHRLTRAEMASRFATPCSCGHSPCRRGLGSKERLAQFLASPVGLYDLPADADDFFYSSNTDDHGADAGRGPAGVIGQRVFRPELRVPAGSPWGTDLPRRPLSWLETWGCWADTWYAQCAAFVVNCILVWYYLSA